MPMLSGRTADGIPVVDEIEWHEIVVFVTQCISDGWKRVAVAECPAYPRILAAYCADVSPKPWFHRELCGSN